MRIVTDKARARQFDINPLLIVVADLVENHDTTKDEVLRALSREVGKHLASMHPDGETKAEHEVDMDLIQGWVQVGFNKINEMNRELKNEQSENKAVEEKVYPAGTSLDEIFAGFRDVGQD